MQRTCTHCGWGYRSQDLAREESKGMEQDRKALGLEGVLFRYYHCPQCAHDDIFLDILPLEGETTEAFHARRTKLEAAVGELSNPEVGLVLVER